MEKISRLRACSVSKSGPGSCVFTSDAPSPSSSASVRDSPNRLRAMLSFVVFICISSISSIPSSGFVISGESGWLWREAELPARDRRPDVLLLLLETARDSGHGPSECWGCVCRRGSIDVEIGSSIVDERRCGKGEKGTGSFMVRASECGCDF